MIENLGFNLTQYTSFRQLQLQYKKLQDENDTLQSQIIALTESYQQKCSDLIQLKKQNLQEKVKFKNKNLKYKRLYRQLTQNIESNLSSLKNKSLDQEESNTSFNDKSIFVHLEETENLEKICAKLSKMTKDYLSLQDKNTQLNRKILFYETQQKTQTLEKQKNQKMILKQIQHLQNQLQELNATNLQLETKLKLKEKQKKKIQIELKNTKIQRKQFEHKFTQLLKQREDKNQEDSQFSLDFMTFQLQTLQNFFNRVTDSMKCSSEISNLLMIIYSDYEQISEVFREKLQIEYDLQELQQRYKSQKACPHSEQNLLIETRRQIETFRLELLKQKQIFRQKVQFIEEHFQEYLKINQSELKVKNYTYEIQNRLYKQKRPQAQQNEKTKVENHTARNILAKRNQSHRECVKQDFQNYQPSEKDSQINQKKTSLRFKQTNNAQQIMREIINKDKNNLEKILKQTRKASIPIIIGK